MAKIAVIVDELYEDSELNAPVAEFRRAGHEVVYVGLEVGKTVTGKNEGTSVTIEQEVGAVSPEDFDALLVPGGYSPDKLRRYDHVRKFVSEIFNANKPTFIICHAAQLLVSARVLEGYTATGHKAVDVDIENAGATFVDREVVVDRNLVSSRTPNDLPAFVEASLRLLETS
jgi:deglycase